ncbi:MULTISPECIES: secretion protein EccK [Mycolicibacterium]|uniref:secretion protein EccK n=1 Tax=Mycolicibacterium TaxID=1866885 RepID=UPI0020CBE77F|nr:secretion protein EccK [Mycolicibacterium sp. PAM1]
MFNQSAPLASSAPAQSPAAPPSSAPAPTTPAGAAPTAGTGAGAGGGLSTSGGPAPVAGAPAGAAPPAAPPVPLAPPTSPAPPAPPPTGAPGAAPAGLGAGVAPMSATSSSSGAAAAPIPVSQARAERDAVLAASTAGALRRKNNGSDPLQRARHIGAALNVGVKDFGFFWVTAVTTDGTIVVANSYGIGYIPDGVRLPENVRMASADDTIPADERAKWATYPILAVQGWAQHHELQLRAVVATEEQFANFDPGVAKIILTAEDIPDDGTMSGRTRLEVISPTAAQQLSAVGDFGLNDLLPPAPTDLEPPADQTATLWFEVAKPLMSTNPQRSAAHLQAFITYANHAQELAVYRAHTAAEPADQRLAIADWVYWQHLAVIMNDAVNADASA